jgi:L-lactate permease
VAFGRLVGSFSLPSSSTTVEAGQSGIIQSSISSLSGDRRLQALLIAFCFSAFLEGVSREGASVAVAAAMLIGLGFKPLSAAVVCLVANTPPVPFGPVGVPTSMMISVTNINSTVMAKTIGSDMAILALVIPFLVLVVISGFKHTIEVWPAVLVAGCSYAVGGRVVRSPSKIDAEPGDRLPTLDLPPKFGDAELPLSSSSGISKPKTLTVWLDSRYVRTGE